MKLKRTGLIALAIQVVILGLLLFILIRWSELDGGAILNRKIWDSTFTTLDQLHNEGLVSIADDQFRDATARITAANVEICERRLLPPGIVLMLGGLSLIELLLITILAIRRRTS
ncbi:MAG: hypothetical protein KDA30_07850 [Phycisphaerales bacterium]|nr:hypothetical protein [Phycisphaerales bacterium]